MVTTLIVTTLIVTTLMVTSLIVATLIVTAILAADRRAPGIRAPIRRCRFSWPRRLSRLARLSRLRGGTPLAGLERGTGGSGGPAARRFGATHGVPSFAPVLVGAVRIAGPVEPATFSSRPAPARQTRGIAGDSDQPGTSVGTIVTIRLVDARPAGTPLDHRAVAG